MVVSSVVIYDVDMWSKSGTFISCVCMRMYCDWPILFNSKFLKCQSPFTNLEKEIEDFRSKNLGHIYLLSYTVW